jgi:hypothetical protein
MSKKINLLVSILAMLCLLIIAFPGLRSAAIAYSIQRVIADAAPGLQVLKQSSGYRHSSISSTIKLQSKDASAAFLHVMLETNIEHGWRHPFEAFDAVKTQIFLLPPQTDPAQADPAQGLLIAVCQLSPSAKRFDFECTNPVIHSTIFAPLVMTAEAGTLSGYVPKHGGDYQLQANLPSLSFELAPLFKLKLNNLQLSNQSLLTHHTPLRDAILPDWQNLLSSQSQITLQEVSFTSLLRPGNAVRIRRFSSRWQLSVAQQGLNVNSDFHFDDSKGLPLNLQRSALKLQLQHLDTRVLRQLQQQIAADSFLQTLQKLQRPEGYQPVIAALLKLLSAKPAAELQFSMHTPTQHAQLHAQLHTNSTDADANWQDSLQIKVSADIAADLLKSLLKDHYVAERFLTTEGTPGLTPMQLAEQQIANMSAANLITATANDHYQLHFKWADQRAMLNGQDVTELVTELMPNQ